MVVKHPCLACNKAVAKHHHATACEKCKKWCHRACGTGYSKEEYKIPEHRRFQDTSTGRQDPGTVGAVSP